MANLDVNLLKEKLYPVAKALFCIGEVCVDVSKCHISDEEAIKKIRGYLQDANLHSRFKVDQLIDECMESVASNVFYEPDHDWLKSILNDPPVFESFKINYPSSCDGCSNNPKNGGSGICNCTIPYFENPISYSLSENCMVNNINGNAYFSTDIDKLREFSADAKRIAEAIERTNEYEKRI